MVNTDKHWWRDIILLTLLLGLLFGTLLGNRSLAVPDEARYSEIPYEMLATDDYVTPHINYIKYFEKPPLFYWLQAGAMKTFGFSEWSARLVTMLMGIIGCLMTYVLARRFYGRRCGWFASAILATSLLYFVMARFITLDMTLTALLTITLSCFLLGNLAPPGRKRSLYMWLMYSFAALVVLTKGLIGIVIPGMIIFSWILVCNEWDQIKTYCIPTGTILFLIIALPWHILVQLRNPEFFHFYIIDQHFSRYLTDYSDRFQPIWYLPATLIIGLFPWIFFLPQALKFNWPNWKCRYQERTTVFLLLWAILIYLFFQLSHSQLPPYLLPIFPPLAILMGRYFAYASLQHYSRGIWAGFLIIGIISIILLMVACIAIPHFHYQRLEGCEYLWLPIALLAFSAILGLIYYWRDDLITSITTFVVGVSFSFISVTLSHALFEQKSIKPLAQVLNPLLKPNDTVISYQNYYQDLPYYTQRRVVIAGWGIQELEFGMQHQNMDGWLIPDATLWKEWHQPQQRIYMIMSRKDYNSLSQNLRDKIYVLAETPLNILVTNRSAKP